MSYCSSCGEPVEGRFCRMCGTPFDAVPAEAVAATSNQQGFFPTTPAHRPTHAQPPESAFESLFRQPDGQINPHSLTQMIPPVEADYRMPPPGFDPSGAAPEKTTVLPSHPGGGVYPPGPATAAPQDWDEDEPGMRKPVLWGTIGAVVAASAVILGLLYIGSQNNGAAAGAGSTASSTPSAVVSTQTTTGSVALAPGSANPSPSASPSPSPSMPAANGGTTLPLSLGSTGSYVHYVQTRLRQLGYYHGEITGQYDQATAQAVISFQAKAQVTGDPSGTVGRSTLTALIAAGSQPNLHVGERSADVKRLQEALNSAEGAGLNVSGRYDEATFAAVATYQARVGVPPTGTMNAQTWAALQSGTIVG